MTTPLPPLGTAERCTKCRCPDIDDTYRADIPILSWDGDDMAVISTPTTMGRATDTARGECILRRCRDCGWAWLEACADTELVTEIDTPGGSIEFAQPVTRAWAQDYRDRFTAGMPDDLLPSGARTQSDAQP